MTAELLAGALAAHRPRRLGEKSFFLSRGVLREDRCCKPVNKEIL
jgi:hypothetical protein